MPGVRNFDGAVRSTLLTQLRSQRTEFSKLGKVKAKGWKPMGIGKEKRPSSKG